MQKLRDCKPKGRSSFYILLVRHPLRRNARRPVPKVDQVNNRSRVSDLQLHLNYTFDLRVSTPKHPLNKSASQLVRKHRVSLLVFIRRPKATLTPSSDPRGCICKWARRRTERPPEVCKHPCAELISLARKCPWKSATVKLRHPAGRSYRSCRGISPSTLSRRGCLG